MPIWPGYHCYVAPLVCYPDPELFHSALAALTEFHDELFERTGIGPERTVLGGFSMGSVMSYSAGLSGDRPKPAGILVFSGFIPTVERWEPDLSRSDVPVFIAHGRRDPVMDVEFAREARTLLEGARFDVDYHESDAAHFIDPEHLQSAVTWLPERV